jgi:hypothetical protein
MLDGATSRRADASTCRGAGAQPDWQARPDGRSLIAVLQLHYGPTSDIEQATEAGQPRPGPAG